MEWDLILPTYPSTAHAVVVTSDASGSRGCGAFQSPSHQWFQLSWPPCWVGVHITVKELIPIVISAATWGQSWHKQVVTFLYDNMAVIEVLNRRSSRDPVVAHLFRCPFFFEAHFKFSLLSSHIAGKMNTAADALSRDKASVYFLLFPQVPVPHTPTAVLLPSQSCSSTKQSSRGHPLSGESCFVLFWPGPSPLNPELLLLCKKEIHPLLLVPRHTPSPCVTAKSGHAGSLHSWLNRAFRHPQLFSTSLLCATSALRLVFLSANGHSFNMFSVGSNVLNPSRVRAARQSLPIL